MVHVEGYAPGKMTLAQVREALGSGQLASSAMVQAGPDEPWCPAGEAIASCIDFAPIAAARAGGPGPVSTVIAGVFGGAPSQDLGAPANSAPDVVSPSLAAAPEGNMMRLLAAGALATLAVVAAVVGGYQFGVSVLLAIVLPLPAFALGGAVLVRRRVAAVPFEALPLDERKEGLLLAWVSGPVVAAQGFGFLVVPYMVALIGIFNVSESEGFDAGRAAWSCGVVLLGALAGVARQHLIAAPAMRRSALRAAAQQWCGRWSATWVDRAGAAAGQKAVERFRLPPDTESHALFVPGLRQQPDMPPAFVDIRVLLTGAFLAIREGAYLDVKGTSMRQGVSDAPETLTVPLLDDDNTKVAEQEAHYKDLVTVDYERTPAGDRAGAGPLGKFRVSLSSGQRIEFPTSEQGVSSALDAIRTRTRAAKLG
jgi:hypothetical protein